MCLISSGIAKPSKKLKVNKLAEDPQAADLEKQMTSETSHQIPDATADDPPLEEQNVTRDTMDVNASHAKPPSPAQPAEEVEDIMVTRMAYTEPGNPTVLSKHSAKQEFSTADKGKWKLDLESYA